MEAEQGKKVRIRYRCRLEDGRVYLVGAGNTLEFVVGSGSVPRSLEEGVLWMRAGERRVVRVPAAEADSFPFPEGSHFAFSTEHAPGMAYDFGPSAGGDVSLTLPGGTRRERQPLPAGADLLLEIEILSVLEEETGEG